MGNKSGKARGSRRNERMEKRQPVVEALLSTEWRFFATKYILASTALKSFLISANSRGRPFSQVNIIIRTEKLICGVGASTDLWSDKKIEGIAYK